MDPLDFFDCNCSIGKFSKPLARPITTKDQCLAEMDYLQIKEAVVFQTLARDYAPSVGNVELLEEIRGEERLHGCWVFPLHPDPGAPMPEEQVGTMLDRGARVARLFPPYCNAYVVSEWACGGLFGALEAHRVPVLLSNSDLGRHPAMTPGAELFGFSVENIGEICQGYPDLPVVIIRFNYENTRLAFRLLDRFPNLFLEISYYSTPRGIESLTRAFGAERLLFGTGMPAINPGVALTLVRYANISDDEKRMIAGDNLRQLLKDVC